MTRANTFRGIEHVGLTVPNHERAVDFFRKAFGATVLLSLTDKGRDPLPGTELGPKNDLRSDAAIVSVSLLRLANGANLEVFEVDRPGPSKVQNIADIGLHHFSVTVEDIDAASAAFAEAGGALLEGPYALTGQEAGRGNRGRFGRTPWGLLIEFEQLPSPMTYDHGASQTRWLPAHARGAALQES